MTITIHSRSSLHEAVHAKPQQLKCVVLFEPDKPNDAQVHEILPQCQDYIAVAFHDISRPREGYVEPNREHIKAILEWAKQHPHDDLHVACRAGISRSSAVAYLIACTRMDPWQAVKILDPHIHSPNFLIIKIGADILGEHVRDPMDHYPFDHFGFTAL